MTSILSSLSIRIGRWIGKGEMTLRHLLLCPFSHDYLLSYEKNHLCLECQRCRKRTKGWEVGAEGREMKGGPEEVR